MATRSAVVALRSLGYSWGAISRQVRAVKSRDAAVKIWKWFKQCKNPTQGRKPVITPLLAKRIDKAIANDPWISPEELVVRLKLHVSVSSVKRYRTANFKSVKGVGRPVLSAKNKKARLNWCRKHLHDNFDDVIFTDEKSFMLYHNRRLAWIKPGGELPFHCQPAHVPRVQVLGGIARQGRSSLVVFNGWLNAGLHQKNLDSLLPSVNGLYPNGFRYLQDNDPSHSARAASRHLKNMVPSVLHLPAQSPDLNPVEHVWSAMDARVAGHHATTKADLERAVRHEWRSLAIVECNRYIDGLRATMEAIIAAKGDHVRPQERRRYAAR